MVRIWLNEANIKIQVLVGVLFAKAIVDIFVLGLTYKNLKLETAMYIYALCDVWSDVM